MAVCDEHNALNRTGKFYTLQIQKNDVMIRPQDQTQNIGN